MPQIYGMGPPALFYFAGDFFRPEKSDGFGRF
jgi:hypothetical protein